MTVISESSDEVILRHFLQDGSASLMSIISQESNNEGILAAKIGQVLLDKNKQQNWKLQTLESKCQSQDENLKECQQKIANFVTRISNLEMEIVDVTAENERLKKDLVQQKEHFLNKKNIMAEESSIVKSKLEALETENETLGTTLKLMREKSKKQEEEIKQLQKEKHKLSELMSPLQSHLTTHGSHLQALQDDIKTLNLQNEYQDKKNLKRRANSVAVHKISNEDSESDERAKFNLEKFHSKKNMNKEEKIIELLEYQVKCLQEKNERLELRLEYRDLEFARHCNEYKQQSFQGSIYQELKSDIGPDGSIVAHHTIDSSSTSKPPNDAATELVIEDPIAPGPTSTQIVVAQKRTIVGLALAPFRFCSRLVKKGFLTFYRLVCFFLYPLLVARLYIASILYASWKNFNNFLLE